MNKQQQNLPERVQKLRMDIKFCTECEKDLDNFFLSNKSKDIDAVKANHENCKQIGKFKGEMCSKIFISKIEEEMNSMENLDDLDDL
jgi:hypothetical protein